MRRKFIRRVARYFGVRIFGFDFFLWVGRVVVSYVLYVTRRRGRCNFCSVEYCVREGGFVFRKLVVILGFGFKG